LIEKDGGKRLFAYAHLYARLDCHLFPNLVSSVIKREATPFGQCRGVQAIGRVIQAEPEKVDSQTRNILRGFLTRLNEGTDRCYELSRIVKSLDAS